MIVLWCVWYAFKNSLFAVMIIVWWWFWWRNAKKTKTKKLIKCTSGVLCISVFTKRVSASLMMINVESIFPFIITHHARYGSFQQTTYPMLSCNIIMCAKIHILSVTHTYTHVHTVFPKSNVILPHIIFMSEKLQTLYLYSSDRVFPLKNLQCRVLHDDDHQLDLTIIKTSVVAKLKLTCYVVLLFISSLSALLLLCFTGVITCVISSTQEKEMMAMRSLSLQGRMLLLCVG